MLEGVAFIKSIGLFRCAPVGKDELQRTHHVVAVLFPG